VLQLTVEHIRTAVNVLLDVLLQSTFSVYQLVKERTFQETKRVMAVEFSEAALVQLREDVAGLSCTAHGELFRLVCKHSVRFSRNNNGVFFCISGVPGESQFLKEVSAFVRFCCDHREQLDEYERTLQSRKLGGGGDVGECVSVVEDSSSDDGHVDVSGESAMAWLQRTVKALDLETLAERVLGSVRQPSWSWCAGDTVTTEGLEEREEEPRTAPPRVSAQCQVFLEPVPYKSVTSQTPEGASG
jgi:hypothetical protein